VSVAHVDVAAADVDADDLDADDADDADDVEVDEGVALFVEPPHAATNAASAAPPKVPSASRRVIRFEPAASWTAPMGVASVMPKV